MPAERVPCPTCGKSYSARGLGTHRARAHGHKAVHGKHGQQGSTFPTKVKAEILRRCRDGESRNKIARDLKVSPAGVSRFVERERDRTGDQALTFNRAATHAATEAQRVDMAARRAKLAQGLLDDVEKLRAQLFSPTELHAFGGKNNTHNSIVLDEPVYADKLKIVQAVGAAIDRHLKLDDHDSDSGAEGARSLLTSLGKALGVNGPPT